MLIRIVKMTFEENAVSEFLKMFEEVKTAIRAMPGCQYLELLSVDGKPNVLCTISHWDNSESLENYRDSPLFADTWSKTKQWFCDKPEAWSLKSVNKVSV